MYMHLCQGYPDLAECLSRITDSRRSYDFSEARKLIDLSYDRSKRGVSVDCKFIISLTLKLIKRIQCHAPIGNVVKGPLIYAMPLLFRQAILFEKKAPAIRPGDNGWEALSREWSAKVTDVVQEVLDCKKGYSARVCNIRSKSKLIFVGNGLVSSDLQIAYHAFVKDLCDKHNTKTKPLHELLTQDKYKTVKVYNKIRSAIEAKKKRISDEEREVYDEYYESGSLHGLGVMLITDPYLYFCAVNDCMDLLSKSESKIAHYHKILESPSDFIDIPLGDYRAKIGSEIKLRAETQLHYDIMWTCLRNIWAVAPRGFTKKEFQDLYRKEIRDYPDNISPLPWTDISKFFPYVRNLLLPLGYDKERSVYSLDEKHVRDLLRQESNRHSSRMEEIKNMHNIIRQLGAPEDVCGNVKQKGDVHWRESYCSD